MTNAAAKGRSLLFLAAAFALCAALLAAPAAEATRTLPAIAEPAQTPQRATLDVLEDATPKPPTQPEKRLRLFDDPGWPTHPLELVQISKTASGVFDLGLDCNILEKGSLGQDCGSPSFQGLWHDPTTGLAYARNRWYDARTASWLSEDPLGPVDSPNLYAFVAWGPHMGRDPMGDRVRDENLFDPNTEYYEVDGKRYQLARSGVVYRFGFFDQGYEDDPAVVAAVRAAAGFQYGGDNQGLQAIAQGVEVTEEMVYKAMIAYWALFAAAPVVVEGGIAAGAVWQGGPALAAQYPTLARLAAYATEAGVETVAPGALGGGSLTAGLVSGATWFSRVWGHVSRLTGPQLQRLRQEIAEIGYQLATNQRGSFRLASSTSELRGVLLGEFMPRVRAAGEATGLRVWPARNWDDWVESGVEVAKNMRWLRDQIRSGVNIYSLGKTPGYSRGAYYKQEVSLLLKHGYRRKFVGMIDVPGFGEVPLYIWTKK
jgi:RHS repeat-associated protein